MILAFHFAIVNDFVQTFNQQANVLVENMAKEAEHAYPFDLYPHLKALAMDIICEAAMGVKMNSQRGKNMAYVKSVKAISELMV
jgi:cytochrome P450